MKIAFINPNATEAMTRGIVATASQSLPAGEVFGMTNTDGPPAIQGPEDGEAAIPGVLSRLPKARADGADAIVIACFDDTGLDEARGQAGCPVLGIGQAAYAMASLMGMRFSVVTSLAVSIPVIEENIRRLGFAGQCASVRASGLPVLTIEEGAPETLTRIAAEADLARSEDGAECVLLGCAGMSPLKPALSRLTTVPLIDGVAASVHLARAAVDCMAGGAD